MKVCVLLPDYSTSIVDYQHYDPPRNLATLLPNDEVVTIFLNKLTTYKQLHSLSKQGFDIFINLCEGYLEWEVPSIDVIYSLELLNLPYTGPSLSLYDPSKTLMKYVAHCANVAVPKYMALTVKTDIDEVEKQLQYPLFMKPLKAGDSLGIDENSLLYNRNQLQNQLSKLLIDYHEILVEEYVDGREFTVLVARNVSLNTTTAFNPIEYIFDSKNKYKTYSLKTSELHPNANIPVEGNELCGRLKNAAVAVFEAFNGVGYARLDFRLNENGELFFLEINFTCSVFYEAGYEGSADYILNNDAIGKLGFLKIIIDEGILRHQQKQKAYVVKGNATDGFGIYATQKIAIGKVIFCGEQKAQRIVTKQFVEKNYKSKEKENFARYAYPISDNVFILWDTDASEWAPQNHSCDANTAYQGLNVIAIKAIEKDEELTLNYETFLNEDSMPFECKCGSKNCKGIIRGSKNNTIEQRLAGN